MDGQDKTIRTLSTQLEDTKEALLQEISHQVAPPAAVERRRRRGDGTTQTGPSLASVAAARGDSVRTEQRPVGGDTGPSHAAEPPATGGGGTADTDGSVGRGGSEYTSVQAAAVSAALSARLQSADRHPQAGPPADTADTATSSAGQAAAAAAAGQSLTLVDTGTSPVPAPLSSPGSESQPGPAAISGAEPESQPAAATDRSLTDALEAGEERNRLEVQRLLAALNAKVGF